MIGLALYGVFALIRDKLEQSRRYLRWMIPAIALPYIANTAGWIMTEIGRQPWVVYGLQLTKDGVSPTVPAGQVLLTLLGFTVVYGVLAAADVYLFVHFVRRGPEPEDEASDAVQLNVAPL